MVAAASCRPVGGTVCAGHFERLARCCQCRVELGTAPVVAGALYHPLRSSDPLFCGLRQPLFDGSAGGGGGDGISGNSGRHRIAPIRVVWRAVPGYTGAAAGGAAVYSPSPRGGFSRFVFSRSGALAPAAEGCGCFFCAGIGGCFLYCLFLKQMLE